MKYESFLEAVKSQIKSYLESEEQNSAVNIRKVLKNNGIELDALTIVNMEYKASPTIYLNRYYDEYVEGRSVEEITEEIIQLYKENEGRVTVDISDFMDYSRVKNKIAFKVINAASNKKLLKKIPHIKKMDLAIVFYYIFKCDKYENATTLIYNHHMEMWDVTLEEIYEDAMTNTPLLLPYEMKCMCDILMEMFGENCNDEEIREDGVYNDETTTAVVDMIMESITGEEYEKQMYVLTNKYKINGAASMFYPNVLKTFAEELGKDLIIIPSSVHEVICIPKEEDTDVEDFKKMIREVNVEEVDPTEVLADHAYVYYRDIDEIKEK